MAFTLSGDVWLRTREEIPSYGAKLAFMFPGVSFAYEGQPQVVEVMGRNAALQMATASSEVIGMKHSVMIKTQRMPWLTFQVLQGQIATTESSPVIKHRVTTRVPESSPYVITDTGLPGTGNPHIPEVQVHITERGTWGEEAVREVLLTGTPAAGQVTYSASAGTLTFNEADAGAPVSYLRPTVYTSVEALGVTTNPEYVGDMECWVVAKSSAYYPYGTELYFRHLTRSTGTSSMNFEQSPVQGGLTFGAIAPPWNPMPFEVYNMNTAIPD
jgi:hypothetical protein